MINFFNETDIENVRGYIYERESSRASTSIVVENIFEEELVREYRNSDFENYQGIKRQGQEGTNNSRNDRNIENGARNSAKVKESRRLKLIDKDYLGVAVVRRTAQNQRFYLHNLTLKKDKPF